MSEVSKRIDGVMIGVFLGFDDDASPLVVFPGNLRETAVAARSMVELSAHMIGAEVALLFEAGDPGRPLIVGRLVESLKKASPAHIVRDGDLVRVTASERIELRCGKSVILMEKDGRIIIRGTNVTTHASAANRIRGGSIDLN